MKYDFLGVIVFGIVLLIGVAVIAAFITVGIFLIRALSRYVKSGNVRKEKSSIKKSLGEVLKQHREECDAGVCCRIYRRKQAGCL